MWERHQKRLPECVKQQQFVDVLVDGFKRVCLRVKEHQRILYSFT